MRIAIKGLKTVFFYIKTLMLMRAYVQSESIMHLGLNTHIVKMQECACLIDIIIFRVNMVAVGPTKHPSTKSYILL